MADISIRDKICHYIAARLPEDTLREIHNGIILKFGAIEGFLQEQFSPKLHPRIRPQMQRYGTDTVLEEQAELTTVEVRQTTPKGERYIEIREPGLTISHIELKEDDVPRPAKHRRQMAGKNSGLEPDLFRTAEEIEKFDSLHVAIVVVVPYAKESLQSSPKNILISVPYSDFRSFHVQIDIEDFYGFYERRNGKNPPMIDVAWPSLKDDILEVEQQDKASNSEEDG